MRKIAVVLVSLGLVAAAAGCASSGPATDDGAPAAEGGMMGLEDESDEPVWKGWTPADQTRGTPSGLARRLRAFDYWRVTDEAVVEDVWSRLFPVLDSVRGGLEADAHRRTADVLLEALESAGSGASGGEAPSLSMDMTFVVSNEDGRPLEGLAARLWCRLDGGAVPVMTVLMLRDPTGEATPGRIVVWASSGFEEAAGWTADFRRHGDGWRRRIDDGLTFQMTGPEGAAESKAARAVNIGAKLLIDAIWARYSGKNYLEVPDDDGVQVDGRSDLEAALGLEVGDRDIDRVYSGTEFPPRVEADSL